MGLFRLTNIAEKLGIKVNEFDLLLKKARDRNFKRMLCLWNRGLGDIPLGLYAFVDKVRAHIPDCEITFLTRPDLLEAFSLLEGVKTISVPWLKRGIAVDVKETLRKLNIPEDAFDLIMERINPTKWFPWQIGRVIPRLKWNSSYDELCRRFCLDDSISYIGVHVNTETSQFYGYKKDWPIEKWDVLFKIICKRDVRVILFGLQKDSLKDDNPFVIDLRGETGLLELLSIIKNYCKVLIAPDSGILSIVYYLDVTFPIKIVSLWSDPDQGILKQSVPSPNSALRHIPLVGKYNDVTNIEIEDVLKVLEGFKQ